MSEPDNATVFGLESSPVDFSVTPGEVVPIDTVVTITTHDKETNETTGVISLRLDDLLEIAGTAASHVAFVMRLRT